MIKLLESSEVQHENSDVPNGTQKCIDPPMRSQFITLEDEIFKDSMEMCRLRIFQYPRIYVL
jgi:hypothetical protein